jgi:hypothetical protein
MAAINVTNKDLTFIHIPKSAGSSVVEWLRNNFDTEIIKGHPNINMIKTEWDVKNTFCIVRNPWARMVSAYFYLQQYGFYWAKNNINTIDDFPTWDQFIMNLDYDTDSWNTIKTNQVKWYEGASPIILRAETLNEDFKTIQDLLQCNEPLGYINTSKHEDYRSYYTQEQRDYISKVFAEDIDMFKYVFQ